MSFGDRLAQFFVLIEEDVAHFDCADAVEQARHILARGTSADLQVAEFKRARDQGATRAEACREVARWLAAHSVPAHTSAPFRPELSPQPSA